MRELLLTESGIPPHTNKRIFCSGDEINASKPVMIMIHGRGATAQSILELSSYLSPVGITYIAPKATNNTWYPFNFMVPTEQNEPFLSSALRKIDDVVEFVVDKGVPENKIMLLGFSQGACLALQYAATQKRKFSGIFGLSGGLIGSKLVAGNYAGNLQGTTVFLGCSDTDFHIPKERVEESGEILKGLGAEVTVRLYSNMGHTVNDDEIRFINSFVQSEIER